MNTRTLVSLPDDDKQWLDAEAAGRRRHAAAAAARRVGRRARRPPEPAGAVSLLLDSVILIDHLNGIEAATAFLREHGAGAAISSVTRAEVLAGCTALEAPRVAALLDRFRFLPMDAPVADEAARVRGDTGLTLPDAIQAAFALRHDLRLATRNLKDFRPARVPFVFAPYAVRG